MVASSSSAYFELLKASSRTRPGHAKTTRKAFDLVPKDKRRPRIVDFGCGMGLQSLELARLCDGQITAVDTDEPFLTELCMQATECGLGGRIRAVTGPLDGSCIEGEYDLIWSEGGVKALGLEHALDSWVQRLADGGCVAFTDLVWLKKNPPAELAAFMRASYPEMRSVAETLNAVENSGLQLLAFFVLPEEAWWEEYLGPLERTIESLRARFHDDASVLELLEDECREIDVRKRFSDYYGAVFFIARS